MQSLVNICTRFLALNPKYINYTVMPEELLPVIEHERLFEQFGGKIKVFVVRKTLLELLLAFYDSDKLVFMASPMLATDLSPWQTGMRLSTISIVGHTINLTPNDDFINFLSIYTHGIVAATINGRYYTYRGINSEYSIILSNLLIPSAKIFISKRYRKLIKIMISNQVLVGGSYRMIHSNFATVFENQYNASIINAIKRFHITSFYLPRKFI